MALNLNNRARFLKKKGKHNWYDWEIFVEGPPEELDRINHVIYFLHESFPNPVRTSSDRGTRFAVQARGWGEFTIRARVVFEDERVENISYWLNLSKKWNDD